MKPADSETVAELTGPSLALGACHSFQQGMLRKPEDREAKLRDNGTLKDGTGPQASD